MVVELAFVAGDTENEVLASNLHQGRRGLSRERQAAVLSLPQSLIRLVSAASLHVRAGYPSSSRD